MPARSIDPRHRNPIRNLLSLMGLGVLLLIGSVYVFGMRPLIDYLRTIHTESIDSGLQSSARHLQAILRHHEDLARQVASRSAMRLQQAAFLRGEITQERLVAHSHPKLDDALHANDGLLGVARYAPNGQRLFAVGRAIPGGLAAACNADALDRIKLLPSAALQRPGYLAYCSPISDQGDEPVGMDLLIMNDQALQAFVNEQSTPTNSMALVLEDHEIGYWPDRHGLDAARQALERFLDAGEPDARFLVRQQPL